MASRFSRPEAEALFTAGLEAIEERYLDPVDLAALGVAGLKGLEALDPSLGVRRAGGMLEIARQGTVIGSFSLSGVTSPAGWGRLIASALGLLHDTTPALQTEPAEHLYKTVFQALLTHLDPFSRYATSEEAALNRDNRNGFGGIGLLYDLQPDALIVTDLLPGAPAATSGLRTGDRIVAIDGHPTQGMTMDAVRDRLRGPLGSPVSLSVQGASGEASRLITLSRALIVLPTVDATLDDTLLTIQITSFNQRTTTTVAEVLSAAQQETRGALKGVVLDLRGNPGGLLDQAVSLSDLFLERGPIVSTRGRHPDAHQFYSASPGDLSGGLPLVVLIDGDSASAAEIVAAALQDSSRAVVVGTTSYGKGTVQTVIQLPNGGEFTLTWSRFHSPSGYVLHGLGVMPIACTSGLDANASPEAVIDTVRSHGAETAAQVASWRTTDPRNTQRRQDLRNGCPAQAHPHASLDLDVAKRLLDDAALYRQALRATTPTQAASGTSRPGG